MKLKVTTLQESKIPGCTCIYAKDSFEYLQPIKKKNISESSRFQNHAYNLRQSGWVYMKQNCIKLGKSHYRRNSTSFLAETSFKRKNMVWTREATKLREWRHAFSEKHYIRILGKQSKTEMMQGYNRILCSWEGGKLLIGSLCLLAHPRVRNSTSALLQAFECLLSQKFNLYEWITYHFGLIKRNHIWGKQWLFHGK